MSRRKKIALFIIAIIIAIPILSVAGVYFGVIRPGLPQLDGEMALPGLTAPVTIQRDEQGIPHIIAADAHDLFFAQGFVHAQDRLWQMESQRRAAHGRLSEVVGEPGLDNDRFMRTLGMTQAAQADWDTLDPDSQAALQAYADGVNAFLKQAEGKLPLEFKILGIEPEPWQPQDTLVFGKLLSWSLSNNYENELVISQLAATTTWENVLSVLPDYLGPDIIPDANLADLGPTTTALLAQSHAIASLVPLAQPDQGSNNWVVGGSHTASGLPLLANDPHQGLSMPSLWYEVGLHSQDGVYDVAGSSLPGIPGIEIGHNARIAWGVTNARPDVQDVFIETLNPEGTQYQFEGEWRDLAVRQESIPVKDGDPVALIVRSTHHGPLVSDVAEDADQHLALSWTGLQGRPLAQAILKIDRAQDWEQFRAGLQDWEVPAMNFVYADVDGNIGYQLPGSIPIRASNDVFSLVPVDGSDGLHEWVDFIPYDDLPHDLNPAGDFFATANNKPVDDSYPYFLSHYFQPNYRVVRISDAIRDATGISSEDFEKLHADWYNALNQQVAQTLVEEASTSNPTEQAVLRALAGWDGMMTPDSGAAAISEAAMRHLIRVTLTPELGEGGVESYLTLAAYPYMYLQNLLDDSGDSWWRGDRSGLINAALTATVVELESSLGEDVAKWTWGDLHAITFAHPLGNVGPLAPIFNRGPFPTGGNWNTVNSGAYHPDEVYAMGLGPAYRIIADPSDWDNTRSVLPTGQSGQPYSRYYDDAIEDWLAVDYHPLPFSPQAIESATKHTLVLTPGE